MMSVNPTNPNANTSAVPKNYLLYKDPKLLGKAVADGYDAGQLVNQPIPLDSFELSAKPKDKTQPNKPLTVTHSTTPMPSTDSSKLTLLNRFFITDPANENSLEGAKGYMPTINLSPKAGEPPLYVGARGMKAEGAHSLGKPIHGASVAMNSEIGRAFNTEIPHVFPASTESLPFHLACGAVVTKYTKLEDLVNALESGVPEDELIDQEATAKAKEQVAQLKTRDASRDNEALLRGLLPCKEMPDGRFAYDQLLMIPKAAGEALEQSFLESIIKKSDNNG